VLATTTTSGKLLSHLPFLHPYNGHEYWSHGSFNLKTNDCVCVWASTLRWAHRDYSKNMLILTIFNMLNPWWTLCHRRISELSLTITQAAGT
jgi:hypothetical protein